VIAPEFSRPVAVDGLRGQVRTYVIEADEAERRALALRFGILGIDKLRADLALVPVAGTGFVGMSGTFDAEVQQACVVTMEPVRARISESFEVGFGPEQPGQANEVLIDIDESDPPEPIVDGKIDLGEVVAQHLSLALDPFPRSPGVEFKGLGDLDTPNGTTPFAILSVLKRK
jgi:uncharacterized metal-binding protein YceD (DUF177 family)